MRRSETLRPALSFLSRLRSLLEELILLCRSERRLRSRSRLLSRSSLFSCALIFPNISNNYNLSIPSPRTILFSDRTFYTLRRQQTNAIRSSLSPPNAPSIAILPRKYLLVSFHCSRRFSRRIYFFQQLSLQKPPKRVSGKKTPHATNQAATTMNRHNER